MGRILSTGVICVCFWLASPAGAAVLFNVAALDATYTRTNPAAGPGEVIGTFTMVDDLPSGLTVTSGATTAGIASGADFHFSLAAQVIRGAAPNAYTILGSATLTDATLADRFTGAFTATDVALTPGGAYSVLTFGGPLSVLPGFDALLINGVGDAWSFTGNQPPPFSPAVLLAGGRGDQTQGSIAQLLLQVQGGATLDEFFGVGGVGPLVRSTDLGDIKITVTPEPSAALAMLVGVLFLARRRV